MDMTTTMISLAGAAFGVVGPLGGWLMWRGKIDQMLSSVVKDHLKDLEHERVIRDRDFAHERESRLRECERLEKEIEKCRVESKHAMTNSDTHERERLSVVVNDVEMMRSEIRGGFSQLRDILLELTAKAAKQEARSERQDERILTLERRVSTATFVRTNAREDPR